MRKVRFATPTAGKRTGTVVMVHALSLLARRVRVLQNGGAGLEQGLQV